MKLSYLFLVIFFLSGCANSHLVHRLDVEQNVMDSITEEIVANCGSHCEVKTCWQENKDVVVCKVEFSFVRDFDKMKILEASSASLAKKNLQVGFCGQDSFGTSMAAAFVGGMAGGVLSHSTGGSTQSGALVGGIGASSGGSEKVFMSKELVQKACGSIPVVDKKDQLAAH